MTMETHSGRYVDLSNPDPSEICIEDIAHHLSNICRYTGACHRHYSVAEHSVLVCRHVPYPGAKLHALLHDAHEAYVGDISRPLKLLFEQQAPGLIKQIEDRLDTAIARALGVGDIFSTWKPLVKSYDDALLSIESRELMPSRGEGWGFSDSTIKVAHEIREGYVAADKTCIVGLDPLNAERRFLHTFRALTA